MLATRIENFVNHQASINFWLKQFALAVLDLNEEAFVTYMALLNSSDPLRLDHLATY